MIANDILEEEVDDVADKEGLKNIIFRFTQYIVLPDSEYSVDYPIHQ